MQGLLYALDRLGELLGVAEAQVRELREENRLLREQLQAAQRSTEV